MVTLSLIPKLTHSQVLFWRKPTCSSGKKGKGGQEVSLLHVENMDVNHSKTGSFCPGHSSTVPVCFVSSDAFTPCLVANYTSFQPQVSRIAWLWAVIFLALRTEEPHTHRKQTKNTSGPKKHSMSQQQRSVVTVYLLQRCQGIPCHSTQIQYR